jgi:hypothetical protein
MGRRIAVTSIIRHVASGVNSGLLRVVDLDSRRTLVTAVVPESAHRPNDPNPRGGLRGARGVSFLEDRFALANTERVFVFDRQWQLAGELTHPWTADIHEVLAEHDGVWITCTACDLLLKLDWSGQVIDAWLWRGDRRLTAQFGFGSLSEFDDAIDYRDPRQRGHAVHDIGHLNAVARGETGVIVSLGRVLTPRAYLARKLRGRLTRAANASIIARPALAALRRREVRERGDSPLPMPDMAPGSSALVLLQHAGPRLGAQPRPTLVARANGLRFPNHNVVEAAGLLAYNDSNRGRLVAFDRADGRLRFSAPVPGAPGYARGLAWLGDETFLVGSQRPTAVHAIDAGRGRVTASVVIGSDPMESVSSVAVLPESFPDPPARLRFRRRERSTAP